MKIVRQGSKLTYHHLPTPSLIQRDLLSPIHQKKLFRGNVFKEMHTIPSTINVRFFQGNSSQSPGSSRTSTALPILVDEWHFQTAKVESLKPRTQCNFGPKARVCMFGCGSNSYCSMISRLRAMRVAESRTSLRSTYPTLKVNDGDKAQHVVIHLL